MYSLAANQGATASTSQVVQQKVTKLVSRGVPKQAAVIGGQYTGIPGAP